MSLNVSRHSVCVDLRRLGLWYRTDSRLRVISDLPKSTPTPLQIKAQKATQTTGSRKSKHDLKQPPQVPAEPPKLGLACERALCRGAQATLLRSSPATLMVSLSLAAFIVMSTFSCCGPPIYGNSNLLACTGSMFLGMKAAVVGLSSMRLVAKQGPSIHIQIIHQCCERRPDLLSDNDHLTRCRKPEQAEKKRAAPGIKPIYVYKYIHAHTYNLCIYIYK